MWTFNSVSNNFRINVNLAEVFASRNYFSAISFFSVLLLTSSNISTMKLLKQPFAWNHHYSKSLAIIKPFHAILAFLDLCWNNHKSNAKIMKHIFPTLIKPWNSCIKFHISGPSSAHPVNIYLLKVNNKNIRESCEICLNITTKTSERRQWRRCGVFTVNSDHISHLTMVNFEQINVRWTSTKLVHVSEKYFEEKYSYDWYSHNNTS